jgi:hypothetical protein
MSTYCAVHIQTEDAQSVLSSIDRYLTLTHRGRRVQVTTADTFGKLYGDEFICSETQPPTKFAFISEQPDWITIHYNSFLTVRELAVELSGELATNVIIVLAQSVSSAYHVEVYRAGNHLRTIVFADGEWLRQEGTPLPFEPSQLGTNISAEDEEPFYWFEPEDVTAYCRHFGLNLWTYAYTKLERPEWTILNVSPD